MGISGLLIGLKSTACVSGHIRDFSGQAVAVDASSWLHKSVYSIADHYVECVEKHSTVDRRCIQAASHYIIKRCQELSCAGIVRVYLVMDGQRCPLKAQTNQDRENRRLQNLQQAREYKQSGKYDKMYEKYRSCIKVHASLGKEVVKEVQQKLKDARIEIQTVWAPYEADAQLIQLCVEGLAHAVITEDSDVLVYSATTSTPVPIIFKLDGQSGKCDIISMSWLFDPKHASFQADELKKSKTTGIEAFLQAFATREARSRGLGVRLFVQACVFAGCDYAPNELGGIGTVTSFKHVRNNIHRNAEHRFRSILQQCGKQATPEYEVLLSKSETIFYYHPVLDIGSGQIKYLNDPHNRKDHQPSLERFSDWSEFLGNVGISVNPRTVPPPPSVDKQSTIPKMFSTVSFAKRQDGAISNPYATTVKQPRHADSRRQKSPLKTLSSNIGDTNAKAPHDKSNPFAKFSQGKSDSCNGMENKRKSDDILGAFYGDNEDVRAVKRTFPKDGSRVTLNQKPKDLPPSIPTSCLSNNVKTILLDGEDDDVRSISIENECSDKDAEYVMSRFFSTDKRDKLPRRVTYEPEPMSSSDWSEPNASRNTLDDFMSPKKIAYDVQPLDEDAIVESSPAFESLKRLRPSFQNPMAIKSQPLCFKFGDPNPPGTKNAVPVRSGRNKLRARGKQTTLFKHFDIKSGNDLH